MPSGSWTCRGGPMDSDETVWMARLIEVVAVVCAVVFAIARIT